MLVNSRLSVEIHRPDEEILTGGTEQETYSMIIIMCLTEAT